MTRPYGKGAMSSENGPAPRLRRVAVVLAGGSGSRVGAPTPKQLLTIAGKPVMEHTIATLQRSPSIDEILVMMAPGHLDAARAIVSAGGYTKVIDVLEGSGTRNDTTRAAIAALTARLGDDDCHVVLHDAVRPMLSQEILEANVAALQHYDAVDTAIASADTVIRVEGIEGVGGGERLTDVLPRAELRRGQTPQSFRLSVLRRAYDLAATDSGFVATDDCTVVLRYLPDVPIGVVRGHESNMKITEPIDLFLADKLFQLHSTQVSGLQDGEALRAALRGRTMVVFGGSYGIGAAIVDLARAHDADVRVFCRTQTGTHVERRSDVAAAAEKVMAESGRVDFVVNAAGVLPRSAVVATTEEEVRLATEINYLAPIWIAQEFYPHLAVAHGSLLLFTSSSYTRGRAGFSLYSSAKAAVVNLTQALAEEWAADLVRVNCVNPERTATPMRTRAFGSEPPASLLSAEAVARCALGVLVGSLTGQVVDVRRYESSQQH